MKGVYFAGERCFLFKAKAFTLPMKYIFSEKGDILHKKRLTNPMMRLINLLCADMYDRTVYLRGRYFTGSTLSLRITSAMSCGFTVTGPRMNSGML